MGIVYLQRCSTCDTSGAPEFGDDGFVGAVVSPSNSGGRMISDGYLAFLGDDGHLVQLPHPVEEVTLKAKEIG